MANIKSQIKRNKLARKQEDRNKSVKSALKTYARLFDESLEKSHDEAKKALLQAVKAWDTAASHGIIHRNKAASKKSAMMRRYNELLKRPEKPVAADVQAGEAKAKKTVKTKKTQTTAKKTAAKPKTAKTTKTATSSKATDKK